MKELSRNPAFAKLSMSRISQSNADGWQAIRVELPTGEAKASFASAMKEGLGLGIRVRLDDPQNFATTQTCVPGQ